MNGRVAATAPWIAPVVALFACGGLALGIEGALVGTEGDEFEIAMALILTPVLGAAILFVQPSILLTTGLGLSLFSGNWDLIGSPVAFDRVVIVAAVAGVAWRAREDPDYRPRFVAVHWILVVAGLYATGSALWAGTLTDHDPFFALLDRFGLICFLLYLVAPVVYRTEEQRNHLLIGLLAIGGYLGFTAFAERLDFSGLVVPDYILNPAVGLHADRVRGPFIEAAANGLALFTCAVAAAMAAARWPGRVRRIAIVIGLACLAGVLFTVTRQAWLGAALGSLLAISSTRRLRPYAVPLIGGGALLVILAFAVVPGLQDQADRRANDQKPVWDRLNSNRAAIDMVEAKPLFGFGWGTFLAKSEPYYSLGSDYPLTVVRDLHSVALSNAVELGLVGAVLWAAGLLLALGMALLRRGPPELEPWRIGLLAIAGCWVVVSNFTPLGYTFSNYLLWIWAGLVGGSTARQG